MIIDSLRIRKVGLIFKAINHQLRQDIINLIAANKKLTVTEIFVQLRIEQSVASQHLAVLRKSEILITTRNKKFIHYEINHQKLDQIIEIVEQLSK